jgi:hypothetical protein
MFFTVSHNSFYLKQAPWISRVVSGLVKERCDVCAVTTRKPVGDLLVALESKGTMWPDVLGCGEYPLLVLSERGVDILAQAAIDTDGRNPVNLTGTMPDALRNVQPPKYFWIDGTKLEGARLDFDASGFVGVRFCAGCGRRSEDVGQTYDRRHSAQFPYKFIEGTWNGLKLFTTDLSPTFFFCTDEVLKCASETRLTNFRFLPIEEGSRPGSSGLDYLGE